LFIDLERYVQQHHVDTDGVEAFHWGA